jgi:hypothetical protein
VDYFADGVPYGAAPEARGQCGLIVQSLMERNLHESRKGDARQIGGMVGGQKM